MAAAAPYRATAISPTRGSHRSVMLCLTTRSRAPPQDPKCGGDRQTDEPRSVSQAGRKLTLWRLFYPKPYLQHRSRASVLTHGGVYGSPGQGASPSPAVESGVRMSPPLRRRFLCRCAATFRGLGTGGLPPLADLPLTGRLVSAVDLPRLLPNAGNLLHRKEACQLDVLYRTG